MNKGREWPEWAKEGLQHSKLVKRIAAHLMGRLPRGIQIEDLIQSGMLGLLEALNNYDHAKGASFETYASIRIRGAMLDEIRKGTWAPRSVHRNTRKLTKAIQETENQMGRDVRSQEVAQNLKMTLEEYHLALQETYRCKMMGFEDVGCTEEGAIEGLHAYSFPTPLEGLQQTYFKESLSQGLQALPARERLVLALYYEEDLNLKEVGLRLGVSESRVSQIHTQAVSRLQSRLKEWSPTLEA